MRRWIIRAALAAAAALGLPAASHAQDGGEACALLRAACREAGFAPAGAGEGAAQVPACVRGLVQNKIVDLASLRPLPEVADAAIAACRAALADNRTPRQSAEAARPPSAPDPAAAAAARARGAPNFVIVMADDLAWNLMPGEGPPEGALPNLARLMAEGMTFERFFVTNSLCCPSRASILTGRLPHNTGVFTNSGPEGGNAGFLAGGNADATLAVALQAAGYRTALMGKYLNGYAPGRDAIPPGWTDWAAGGNAHGAFNEILNRNGTLVRVPGYLTDTLAALGVELIREAAGQGPFMLVLSAFAPHAPFIPPDRYRRLHPGLAYPRTPAFGARPGAASPSWLAQAFALNQRDAARADAVYRERLLATKAVDDLLGAVRAELAARGLAGSTYVIFLSDNGLHLGEYSLRQGKMTPFDIDTRVPLVIAGPGVAAGRRTSALASGVDVLPTLATLAGLGVPGGSDGASLVPLLAGAAPPAGWRQHVAIEHRAHGPRADDPDHVPGEGSRAVMPDSYLALRLADALYVEYTTGERSFYDLAPDPDALANIHATLSPARARALAEAAAAVRACRGAGCLSAQALDPLAVP